MSTRTEFRKFVKSFSYAGCGILHCIKTQRNMRFHIGAAGAVTGLALLCGVTGYEVLALLLTIGGVMALECVNTAVENAVDLASKGKKSEYARAAKDCAAGAVLVFCMAAVGVAVCIFGKRLPMIFDKFAEMPVLIAAAAIYAALWFVWVFVCFSAENKGSSKEKQK